MNISDRTESQPPHVPIPDHLNFALLEVVEQGIREAADQPESDRQRVEVSQAVHLRDAYMTRSLTPAQLAELAGRAAQWLQIWPENAEQVKEVERLLGVTRDLLELGGRALALAHEQGEPVPFQPDDRDWRRRGGPRILTISPELVEVLRSQSLRVLEFNHEPLEDIRDLQPSALMELASIFRDAISVLDTIGWLNLEEPAPVDVALTAGHITQLGRLRDDLALAILDQLDSRAELTDPADIAQADATIEADRRTTHGLLQILQAFALET
jgi:hypothetical protein